MSFAWILAAAGVLTGLGATLLALRATFALRVARSRAAAAERTASAKLRALSLVAADLRGPGLAMLGHATRLRSLAGGESDALAVEALAHHLLTVADDVADLAAADAGPPVLREEQFPLEPLLAEAIAATAAQLGPATRLWRVAPEAASLWLEADRRALRGALLHVLARAARLSRDGDWVEIRLVEGAETLSIVIEDEGAGLTAEDLDAEARETGIAGQRTRGLGLGLAVARSLLQAHGGDLVMEATRGVGARAWLTLPRQRQAAPPALAAA